MKTVQADQIRDAIAGMCKRANFELTEDMRSSLRAAADRETTPLAKNTLFRILQNADIAKERSLPMCQDTGLVVVFADVGQDVHIKGSTCRNQINDGIPKVYKEGSLRKSVTGDPIQRGNTGDNTPAVVHTDLV